MEPKITWLGHASFMIESGGKVIYIDPWKLKDGPKADLLLITHSHFDHFSQEDIDKVAKDGTVVLAAKDVKPKGLDATPIVPGQVKDLGWARIEGHRAYNPAKQFHPKENDWLGFVIEVGGKRIYHSGDTDVIPEMKDLNGIDTALVPVGGTYTMDPAEAARAVAMFHPGEAIPMHWGDIVGDRASAEEFRKLSSVPVRIIEQKQ